MLVVETVARIRREFFVKGKSIIVEKEPVASVAAARSPFSARLQPGSLG
jgi:hypothetical protein